MTRRPSPEAVAGSPDAVERTLDESAAFDRAVRLLTRKARSVQEIRDALESEGVDDEVAANVVSRLLSLRHLDDAELASDQAFALLHGKGYSPAAIHEALTRRGIASALVDEAIAAAVEGREALELCAAALQRRLGRASLTPDSAPKHARALARLGWDAELIRRVIERALPGGDDVPGVDDVLAPKRRSSPARGAPNDSLDEDGEW